MMMSVNNWKEINKQTIPFGIWSGKTTLISLSLIYLIIFFAICRWCSWKNGHQIEIFNSFRWFKIRKTKRISSLLHSEFIQRSEWYWLDYFQLKSWRERAWDIECDSTTVRHNNNLFCLFFFFFQYSKS